MSCTMFASIQSPRVNKYTNAGSLLIQFEAILSTTKIPKGANVQWFQLQLSEMKIYDFGQHFLLVLYMLNFCPFGAKKVSFNR